jgi:hypothetical protein
MFECTDPKDFEIYLLRIQKSHLKQNKTKKPSVKPKAFVKS